MAISELSVFISTDKDVQLNKKDSTKGCAATDNESTQGGDFFTQLQTAHNSVEPLVKEPNSSKLSELVVVQDKAESTEKTAIDNDAESDSTISGDDMLAQITAANNMDTSVNSTSATNSTLTTQFGSYQEEAIDPNTLIELKTPRPIDKVTPIIDTPLEADEPVDKQLKATLLTEKTVVAEAIDKQLQLKGNTAGGDAVTPIIDDVQSVKDKQSAKDEQLAKDMPLNKVLAQQSPVLSGSALVKEVVADSDGEKIKPSAYASQAAEQSSSIKGDASASLTEAAAAIKTALMAGEASNTKPVNTAPSAHAAAQHIENPTKPNDAALDQSTKLLLSEQPAGQKNADPLLVNLTPEQRQQLQTQVNAIREQGATTANVTDLKQILAEFVELNSKEVAKPSTAVATMNTAELTQLSKDISLLSPVQKQALSQQLQNFVSTEQPKGALLTQINTAIAALAQPQSTEKLIESKAQLTVQSMTDNLASTATTSSRNTTSDTNNKVSMAQDTFIKAASKEQEVKLAVQDNVLKSDQFAENIKTEQSQVRDNSLTRVNQLFGQITGLATALTATAVSEGSEQSYQQALADMQVMHAQQASPTSATKQVNLDPTVLQALNIVKSDAAKLLQERVSALLSINNKEAEIRLDPPEMGSMQIRIRSDAEQAHINFVVQNQQAKEALEQSLPRLRELLAQQGIELGESSIQQGNSQAEHGADGQQNGQGQSANQQQNEQQDSVTQQSSAATGQQSSSSIDYYA
ncbi:flagellar hook-length control protein FliK [Pseudoalteromonas prydzensis]|uniref:Flagellar hook-length control protein FliK n=1 Tax=Pseudoalteromonas prydzensis TaxID=182141 RepID=A0ABR9FJ37_9GAMM|nr:flagellar hook-length control protein FliK [Pseudoalteromonas prydzensis]MBE0456836.1 flagellar hook-length control protein FliK [Pseudoalteromonas prydzensis]